MSNDVSKILGYNYIARSSWKEKRFSIVARDSASIGLLTGSTGHTIRHNTMERGLIFEVPPLALYYESQSKSHREQLLRFRKAWICSFCFCTLYAVHHAL